MSDLPHQPSQSPMNLRRKMVLIAALIAGMVLFTPTCTESMRATGLDDGTISTLPADSEIMVGKTT